MGYARFKFHVSRLKFKVQSLKFLGEKACCAVSSFKVWGLEGSKANRLEAIWGFLPSLLLAFWTLSVSTAAQFNFVEGYLC